VPTPPTPDATEPQAAATAGPELLHWHCPSCGTPVTTRYCPGCGERPLDPRHLTVRGLFEQFVAFLVSLDHRIINSVRCLVRHPGQLTLAFESGRRQGYIGPFKLFVLANLLFFAVQSLTELHVFSTPLARQLQGTEGSDIGRALLHEHLDASGLTAEEYAPIYDQAVSIHARSMIGLMILPFAAFLPLVFWRQPRPFAVYVVFSLHFYSFQLLLYCLPAAAIATRALLGGGGALSPLADNVVSVTLATLLASYLYLAIRRVFRSRRVIGLVQTLLLTALQFACFLAYRFALVPITIYLT